MITKITGEQPFQVLTSNYSISPSNEGYTLQISADGKNYSNLFTVGAGVTRLVTGVAANSYYRLSGNQSKVSINWMKTCVTEGGSGSGTELAPVEEFPLGAEAGTVVAYNGTASASGVYQYTGEEWVPVGVDDLSAYWTSAETKDYVDTAVSGIDLSNYYTKAETDSAITAVEDHIYDVEQVTASALTELHNDILELSGATPSTEEIELPIAAAVNELKGDFEARLNQQYYKKTEVDGIAARKVEAGQVDAQIKDYVDPAIAEVNDTIEDKELQVSAALNKLNEDIATIDEVIPAAIVDINDRMVSSSTVKTIWRGSQNDYDAITVKDAATLYIII